MTRTTIALGTLMIDVYKVSDEYLKEWEVSISSISQIINRPERKLKQFLEKFYPEYSDCVHIPLKIATDYWLQEAAGGVPEAQALLRVSVMECIQRRIDNRVIEEQE